MLRPGSMLHIQKDAWFWGQDGGTAVTALSLAGALAAGLRLGLCVRVRGFQTTTLGRAHSANLIFPSSINSAFISCLNLPVSLI